MTVQAISTFFRLGLNNWQPSGVELPENPIIELDGKCISEQDIIAKAILKTYDIRLDDMLLRKNPGEFEKQRGDYLVRREFQAFIIKARNMSDEIMNKLRKLGFNIQSNR